MVVVFSSVPFFRSSPIVVRGKEIPTRVVVLTLGVALSIATAGLALVTGAIHPGSLQEWVASTGSQAMVAYIVVAVVMELLWFPRMWVLIGGGALFGPLAGILLSMVADTIGAVLCYTLARSGGREWVASMVARRPRAKKITEVLARKRGGWTVAVLRVVPIAHYTLVSYMAGLSGVRWRSFLIGNTIGLVPSAVAYVIVGDGVLRNPTSPLFIIAVSAIGLAFVATIVAGRIAVRRAKAAEEARETV